MKTSRATSVAEQDDKANEKQVGQLNMLDMVCEMLDDDYGYTLD